MTTPTWSAGKRAFSLVELTAVLAVIAVAALMVAPRLGDRLQRTQLEQTARRLKVAAQYARSYALRHQCEVWLRMDLQENRYLLQRRAEGGNQLAGGFVPLGYPAQKETLEKPVRFGKVQIENDQSPDSDSVSVRFSPAGSADAALLAVTDGQRSYFVAVIAATGRVLLLDDPSRGLPRDRQDLDEQD